MKASKAKAKLATSRAKLARRKNKKALRHFYDEAFGKGNISMVDEQLDRNFVEHEPLPPGVKPGPEGLKQLISALWTGFPDLQVAVNEMVSVGDKVWARETFSGTHKGMFMNIPPTGKHVSWEGMDIVRFSGGKVMEHWGVTDNIGLLTQIGAIPPPAEPPKK